MIALFEEYMQWAINIARHEAKRRNMNTAFIVLKQGALIGLWNAARRYKKDSGVEFKSFAYMHVIGGMLDDVRAEEGIRRGKRKLPTVRLEYQCEESGEEFGAALQAPEKPCMVEELDEIKLLLALVPLKYRGAVYLHRLQGWRMVDIAKAMGVTDSRISQMVTQGLRAARRRLGIGTHTRERSDANGV